MIRLYAGAARFCTSFEDRPNALDGRRRLDRPDYRPFSDVTVSQIGICRGKFRAHPMILAASVGEYRPENLSDPIHEHAHALGEIAPMRIEQRE
jgi:hypothetical protein